MVFVIGTRVDRNSGSITELVYKPQPLSSQVPVVMIRPAVLDILSVTPPSNIRKHRRKPNAYLKAAIHPRNIAERNFTLIVHADGADEHLFGRTVQPNRLSGV